MSQLHGSMSARHCPHTLVQGGGTERHTKHTRLRSATVAATEGWLACGQLCQTGNKHLLGLLCGVDVRSCHTSMAQGEPYTTVWSQWVSMEHLHNRLQGPNASHDRKGPSTGMHYLYKARHRFEHCVAISRQERQRPSLDRRWPAPNNASEHRYDTQAAVASIHNRPSTQPPIE